MNSKVLLVGAPSDGLRRALSGEFWIQTAANPAEVLPHLSKSDCVALICCLKSESLALNFLQNAAQIRPEFPAIVLVQSDWKLSALGVSATANRAFLILPAATSPELVQINVRNFLGRQAHYAEQKSLFETSVAGTVAAVFETLSIVDPYSASLGQRLRYAVDLFCRSASLDLTWELETGALLAEIGMLTVPVRVVMKHHSGQELSPFEKDMIAHVPERGGDFLQQMPFFRQVSAIIRYQGKNFEGTGLPADSLAGEKLPLGARILKVLNDLFRIKENGKTHEDAIAEMESREGRYDPHLLQIAKECFNTNMPFRISASTLPLPVKDLRPGQLLVSKIETDDGVLLIRDGQVISPRLLHKLRNFAFTSGIKEPIYVIDLLESRNMTTTFRDIASGETSFFAKSQ